MILYIENPKDSIRKLLELISEFSKVYLDIKSIHRNHLHFYILTIKNQKKKLRNQSHSPLQDIKSIHRNHLHFYILTMKNQKKKLRNQSLSPLQQKELNI